MEAVIELEIFGAKRSRKKVRAVIDTGFNGHLTLPAHLISRLKLERAGKRGATLGDGNVVALDAYFAEVSWHHGQAQEVLVLAAEGGPLVGMSLLYGSRVVLEALEEGEVTIEPLPDQISLSP